MQLASIQYCVLLARKLAMNTFTVSLSVLNESYFYCEDMAYERLH